MLIASICMHVFIFTQGEKAMKKLILAGALVVSAGYSNAGLLTYNGYTLNDQTSIVSGGGLDWLRWDTALTNTYATIKSDYFDKGWRFAKKNEVSKLVDSLIDSPNVPNGSQKPYGDGVRFIEFMGSTGGRNDHGYIGQISLARLDYNPLDEFQSQPSILVDVVKWADPNSADPMNITGTYVYSGLGTSVDFFQYTSWAIVRDIPDTTKVSEPATLPLIGIGLAAVSIIRRKKKKSDF